MEAKGETQPLRTAKGVVSSHPRAAKGVIDSHPLKRKAAEAKLGGAKPTKPKPNVGSGPRPEPDPGPNPRPKPKLKSLFQPLSRPARPDPTKKQRTAAQPGGDNQRTELAAAAVAKGGRGGKGGTTSGRGQPASVDAEVERALEAAGADVEAVEARLRRGEAAARRGEAAGEAGSLRDTLAQLHGDATRLLAETVDSILTSEMSDARRDAARAGRKALGARLQHAIDRVEQLVRGFLG